MNCCQNNLKYEYTVLYKVLETNIRKLLRGNKVLESVSSILVLGATTNCGFLDKTKRIPLAKISTSTFVLENGRTIESVVFKTNFLV